MKTIISELKYSNTNTYLIEGSEGTILFDTGWAGTFVQFCSALGSVGKKLQDIDHILVSHFHPDHMGIAQEIADQGPVITIVDLQRPFVHSSDQIFAKDTRVHYEPIKDDSLNVITIEQSRDFLKSLGIDGEIIHTPGHSEDSISLWLDEGSLFVGDLNPLYELELHKGTEIEKSWNKLLEKKPKAIYYGHAKTYQTPKQSEWYGLVSRIMKYIDKGYSIEKIQRKTAADIDFIEDVNRMYLTHQNVGVQGILDRIEIKNK